MPEEMEILSVSKEDYTIDEVVYLTKAHGIKKAAPKTVRKACADGRLPAYKLDAAWRIRRQAVLKVLKDGIPPETTTKRPQRQGRAATRYSPPLRLDQNLPRGQVL